MYSAEILVRSRKSLSTDIFFTDKVLSIIFLFNMLAVLFPSDLSNKSKQVEVREHLEKFPGDLVF